VSLKIFKSREYEISLDNLLGNLTLHCTSLLVEQIFPSGQDDPAKLQLLAIAP